MNPFPEITRSSQVRRLRRLALLALSYYDLGNTRTTLLHYWNNTIFRIDIDDSDGKVQPQLGSNKERYVLRIHRPEFVSKNEIESELTLLEYIRCTTSIQVPLPIYSRANELVQTLSVPGLQEPRSCSVLSWIPGWIYRKALPSLKIVKQMGRLLGQLHDCTERFTPPPGFVRPRWDIQAFSGHGWSNKPATALSNLPSHAQPIVSVTIRRIEAAIASVATAHSSFGLIHGDFKPQNIVFDRGDPAIIDFDNCGWGYYVYDLATFLKSILYNYPHPTEYGAAFVDGYLEIRQLSAQELDQINAFICARTLFVTLWYASHLPDPAFQGKAMQKIEFGISLLEDLEARKRQGHC